MSCLISPSLCGLRKAYCILWGPIDLISDCGCKVYNSDRFWSFFNVVLTYSHIYYCLILICFNCCTQSKSSFCARLTFLFLLEHHKRQWMMNQPLHCAMDSELLMRSERRCGFWMFHLAHVMLFHLDYSTHYRLPRSVFSQAEEAFIESKIKPIIWKQISLGTTFSFGTFSKTYIKSSKYHLYFSYNR